MRARAQGFTLLELLVATALLAVVLTLVVQVVQYSSRAARHGQETAEAFSSARAVLDTVGRDLENAVIRDDLAAFPDTGVSSKDGLSSFAFYARLPGVTSNSNIRRVSLVRYTHDTNLTTLMRSDMSIGWDETNRITFGNASNLPMLSSVQARKLCDGVLGFDVVYIHKDGTFSKNPSTVASPVRAIRVTVALVDPEASMLLTRAKLSGDLVNLFATNRPNDATSNTKVSWSAALNTKNWDGFPEAVRRRLKVYERFITLPQS